MAALAKRLGVSQSTLTNIQNGNRSAGPELVEKIGRMAPGVDGSACLAAEAIEKLAEEFGGGRLSIGQRIIQDYNRRIEKLLGLDEDPRTNIEEIRLDFEALGEDDVFIYLSATKQPLEMDREAPELRMSIASAIERRAFFLYLRPTQTLLRKAAGNYWEDIPAEFAKFKDEVLSNISKEKRRPNDDQRLRLIETDRNPLFALPDFKWELFLSDTFETPYKAAAGALVSSGLTQHKAGPNIRIRLSTVSTRRILFEVVKTIVLENKRFASHDRLPVELLTRLKASAKSAAGEAIDG